MKKFGIVVLAIFGAIFLAAIAANFIIPMFVSVDDYKEKIQEEFQKATGYKIEFGTINLALLPRVHASATDVRISNNSKVVAEIAELNAYADPMLLIKGNLKVSSVDLNKPKIFLEKYTVGNNWNQANALTKPKNANKPVDSFSIDKVNIIDGALSYSDDSTHKTYQITKANLSSAFKSIESPIELAGNFEFAKNSFQIETKITDFNQIEITLDGISAKASFNGTKEKGEFKASGTDLNKIAALLGPNYAINLPKPNFVAEGNFIIGAESNFLDMTEFKVGDSVGAGKIAFQTGNKIVADIKMDNLVIEDWIQEKKDALAKANPNQEEPPKKLIPEDLNLRLSLQSKKLKYKNLNFSNLDLQSAADKGEVILQPLSFNFEDGGNFEIFGVYSQPTEIKKVFEGKMQASGNNLLKLFSDYGIDVSKINPDRLKKFSIDTNLFVNLADVNSIDLSGIQLEFDNTKFSGSTQILLNEPNELSVRGGFSSLNLDDLFVKKQVATSTADIKQAAKNKLALDFSWLRNLDSNLKLALIFGELISDERTYQNLQFTAVAQRGKMQIENFAMRTSDTDISGDLNLDVIGNRPNITTNLNIGVINLEPRTAVQQSTRTRANNSTTTSPRWSQEPFNFSPFDEIDASFNVNLLSLRKDDMRFDNIQAKGTIVNAKANISDLTALCFGGKLSVAGTIGIGTVPELQMKFVGENMELRQLADQLASNNKVSGLVNTSGNLSSSGLNEATLIQELKGAVGFAGTNLIIYGFDLEGFVNKLVNINNPLEVGVMAAKVLSGSGQTLVASLQGSFGIDKGIANAQNVSMLTRVGQGLLKGNIDLPKWQMDTNAYFAINLGDQKERPQIGVRMYGPIEDFKKDYDYSEIVSYYSKRFGIGDKIDNFLDKVLVPQPSQQ